MLGSNTKVTLAEKNWSSALRREIARICLWPAVRTDRLTVSADDQNRIYVSLSIETERLLELGPDLIRDLEPIVLVYPQHEAVGIGPPAVWSGRADFPRHIGHINPTPADHPASLCLARAGLQPIYDRYGIDGVMARLLDWLHSAKTGSLMADEWEPVPMGEGQSVRGGYINIGFLQERALKIGVETQWICGVARLLTEDLGKSVVVESTSVHLSSKSDVRSARQRIKEAPNNEMVSAYIPWVFVWSDFEKPISDPVFGVWNDFASLLKGIAETSLATPILGAIIQTLDALGDEVDRQGGRSLVLLIGIWRPIAISEQVFGVSKLAKARRLEIRGFVLRRDRSQSSPIDDSVEVEQLTCIQLPTREMLSRTSGLDTMAPVALLGYGALGSAIADYLVRAGIPKIVAIDKDRVEPHNLARHVATVDDLHAPKVTGLERLASRITFFPKEIECDVRKCDLLTRIIHTGRPI